MTNDFDIRKNIAAAVGALAVSTVCILGTVGPVRADTANPVQLHAVGSEVQTVQALRS